MTDAKTATRARGEISLERYRARLGFWQGIWGVIFTGGVAFAIPGAVEVYKSHLDIRKAELENAIKIQEVEGKRIDSRQQYISTFLSTAINQDIELRLRLSEYFAFLSDDKDSWSNFHKTLEMRRKTIRDEINAMEAESQKIRSAVPGQTLDMQERLAVLGRELDWRYAEIGYIRKDTNVSAPISRALQGSVGRGDIIFEDETLFRSMTISADRAKEIDSTVDKIVNNKNRYEIVAAATKVPWFLIGVAHQLEASGDFNVHLNGDPLTDKTKRPPIGLPINGSPPFTWEDSTIAITTVLRTNNEIYELSSIGDILYELERINGFGYRKKGMLSPYIWACTTYYSSEKNEPESGFEARTVSKRCGAASILKRMIDRNLVQL